MRVPAIALSGLGDSAACGANPCSTWDETAGFLLPFTMSANCEAYLACAATGGAVTPSPSNIWSVNGGTGTPDPSAGGVQSAQAKCEAAGNTWNPLTSTCTPAIMTYVPWILAGAAALLVVGFVFGGRR